MCVATRFKVFLHHSAASEHDDMPALTAVYNGTIRYLWIVPILVTLNGVLGIWVVFGVAWCTGTVNLTEAFPYISSCGDQPPASCWFSQVCNNGCILAIVFETLEFLYQNKKLEGHKEGLNLAGYIVGIFSSIGLSVTGNFQVSNIPSLHYIGAVLAFVGGLVYLWIQLFLSYISKCLQWTKLIISIIYLILLILFGVFKFCVSDHAAAIVEWMMATIFFLFYAPFAIDFNSNNFQTVMSLNSESESQNADSTAGDPESSTPPASRLHPTCIPSLCCHGNCPRWRVEAT